MIPDQGTLGETAPAKLLLALYEQKQTGILYFRQNEVLKVFYLNRGKISWAISSDEGDKIEHILLAKKMISPEVLAPYKTGNKIAESFGKILVENGMLSLESLITATREQVRHIAASVLRWGTGNYQLVQESPPTRLVSLDLEIPGLVSSYVLSQMDVNIVWEELGSLSGELEQTHLPEKKNLYPLDVEQQEVFSRFQQPQRLESVLLDFPAERKYRILKILYFFLLSGLLSKKEAEKTPSLNFNELDSLFGQDPPAAQAEVDINMPDMINDAEIKDIPLAELPDISVLKNGEEDREALPELPDLMPPEIAEANEEIEEYPAAAEKALPRIQPLLKPEKQKPRWRSITFLSILLAAVLIGLFLWLTRSPEKQEPAAAPAAASQSRPKKQPPQETVPLEQTNEPQPDESQAAAAEPARQPADAGPESEKPVVQKEKTAAVEKKPATSVSGVPAGQRFSAGNFSAAADIWRGELLAAQIKYSILLEMDCLKASVRIAYNQVTDKDNFFILNKTSRDGRRCWLVLWGRYRTQDEAALGMKQVPEYFWKQNEPPTVIELQPYL
jgi:hypothetical protein